MTDPSLGHLLGEARRASGRSLRGVATEVEMAPSYLQNLEHDKVRTPSPRHLKGLADALGLDYVVLMRAAGYHMPPARARLAVEPLGGVLRNARVSPTQVDFFGEGNGRVVLVNAEPDPTDRQALTENLQTLRDLTVALERVGQRLRTLHH